MLGRIRFTTRFVMLLRPSVVTIWIFRIPAPIRIIRNIMPCIVSRLFISTIALYPSFL